ncbi:hypothetical protein E8E15_004693 [Penicillium rubens]|uniref:Pc13g11900 protein n=2 Tax=Penicillium chrysogenum species complex TaxID=254878 RepID=B6H523_PENRW|nr:uncharacterized protein N7525_002981 [Penicillium rubens]KAJ5286185.1 hypothetical protein N7524_001491 [Penicillium chrysogenum]CAP92259.1 Pc13g11900 [Penicillium rubens Wisconsin 54-1255]KAF3013884.1 hypothetical protein E8E15_004693 [Penicillium rubens]KAJ5046125.1 hypothetical protein NUH16_002950 [Penicillium rubens]KAJ5837793.1 hypothetical protein N7525_002981 [Penicillium rubens]
MAGDEYSVGGGKLKLKGSKVSGGRIEKKKKKSTKKKEGEATQSKSESTPDTERPQSEKDEGVTSGEDRERERERDAPGKTEAEKRAEEIRRKRLHERLQREGVKTHKERVEELNKYLSRLSEHHDMPKIGPG